MRTGIGCILMLIAGCESKEPSMTGGDSGATDTAESTADGNDGGDSGPATSADMPSDPAPFMISLSDGSTLSFDQSSCQHFRGSTNFRAFWRDSARGHQYVLTMQVMQTFSGAGVYDNAAHRVDVKLQEEAPQTGAPTYWTDPDLGDTASVTVVYIDEDIAWGEASISGLHEPTGGAAVAITPTVLPIWCTDLEI